MYYHVSQVVLGCESAAFEMRKCRFWDAKVPLLGCESAALVMRKCHFGDMKTAVWDLIWHWRMMFLALLHDIPFRHWREKTGNKAGAADSRNGVWGTKSAVCILRFVDLTYVNGCFGTVNSPLYSFCTLHNMFTE